MNIIDQYNKALLDLGILNWDCGTNGEIKFLTDYLSPLTSPVVFDIGANVGNYSESVKKICNSAQVYAFEPHPATFTKLKQSSNKYNYNAINCGLGNETGNAILYDYMNDDGSEHASLFKNVIEQIHGGESKAHAINIKKLDDIIFELDINRINLLKIDTEGNELSVLMGGEESIRKGKIDVIHFEFNEMNVISRTFFKDFFDFLPEYDFYRLLPDGFFHINTYTPRHCEIFAYQNIVCVKKQTPTQNRVQSDLDKIIPPEIKNDEFYRLITKLAQDKTICTVLEIGSSAGGGSTEAFVAGLEQNPNSPNLFCMEVSQPRFEALRTRYSDKAFVNCYNTSSVSISQFPSAQLIENFYRSQQSGLNQYPLEQILGWLNQDLEYVRSSGFDENGIARIRRENNIGLFDMVLIDGSEFTGKAELDEVYGAKWLLLDDINTYKNFENHLRLSQDASYELLVENRQLRNGYSVFKRKEVVQVHDKNKLPIHFFTIVLNGEPFIHHHIKEFSKLPFSWHWHIVEGVAELKHDTAWSVALGGQVTDELHHNGLSNDGTSAYLDELARKFPEQITIYRKPPNHFWDGKLEMVQAPLPNITEECLLWQVDVDEFWTAEQICTAREMFLRNPDKTAAFYWCRFFVGPDRVVSTRNCYSQNPSQEWLRTWRYKPGLQWAAHEPPRLAYYIDANTWRDVALVNPFNHAETEAKGLVFQHYAYTLEKQLAFKERYYGYKGAVDSWKALQRASLPTKLSQYFSWVSDDTEVDKIRSLGVSPLMSVLEGGVSAVFKDNKYPLVIIDGIFFQLAKTGIARLWSSLLTEWSNTDFAPSIILLDRAGTAPHIDGIRTIVIPAYDYNGTDKDRALLQAICDEEEAVLFVSSYYTTPLTTPSVFFAYDMIPENTSYFDLTAPMWLEKHYGINHASAYIAISSNTAMDLVKAYPAAMNKITIAYPAVDRSVFFPAPPHETSLFKEKYGLGKPYVLFVGSRQNYKNAKLLFEGIARLNSSDLEIVCVGGQPGLESDLCQLVPNVTVRMLDLDDSGLRRAYSGAVAFVYPSLYEGFGLPILEAMACDCPVITCQNSSIPEAAGDAVLYVASDSPEEMSISIQNIQKTEIRDHYIQLGRKQVQNFSWSKMADEVREAFLLSTQLPHPAKIVVAANLVPFTDEGQRTRQEACIESITSLAGSGIIPLNICYQNEIIETWSWQTAPVLKRSADLELKINGKRKPFVADLFNSAAEWAHQHGLEWFALTNSDIIFTQALIREINRGMAAGVDTIAVSRNEVSGVDADGNLVAGELVINGYDIFFCRTEWWRSHHQLFQPYIFGERAWDNAYAAIMASSSRFRILCTDGLCLHFPHATDWLSPGPYADYNLSIYLGVDRPNQERYSAFIKQLSAIPRNEISGERIAYLLKQHFTQQKESSGIQILNRHAAPKISIVTPSFNQGNFLEECMDSILSQNYPNLEYIVMDGGSSDGSVQIIKKFEKHLSYWQSRPDGGQYRAINEGFRRSTGEIMAWLNSDDKYHPGALTIVAEAFSRCPGTEWLMGRPTVWNEQGQLTMVLNHLPRWSRDKYLRGEIGPPHIQQESTFWRRTLWDRAGGYIDLELQLAGDMELWARFFRHAQLFTVDAMLGGFRSHSAQKSANFMDLYNQEAVRVIDREIRFFSGSPQSELLPAPAPITLDDILSAPDLSPAPGTFDLFTYSRKAHFSLFHQHARHLFGHEIDEDLSDLKAYQDLLVYSFITSNIPKGSRILEIGGGDSRVLRAIAGEYECWNLDKLEGIGNGPTAVSPAGYRVVRDYIGDFNQELPNDYFDLVFSISVLEHIPENEETFTAIRLDMERLMKPGAFSLHCFDIILQQEGVWTNSLLQHLFTTIPTINRFVPLHHLSQDPSLYVMSETAYRSHWMEVTKMPYHEFGKPLSYNILWAKPSEAAEEGRTASDTDGQQYDVSVLVSTYNSADFIHECLEDLVAQTISDRIEIIVIDAASPQREADIVAEFQRKHPNITYVRTGCRIGVYPAWNMAIRMARGKYITPFSTNDRLRKDAYEIMTAALERNSDVALVYGDSYHTKIPHETFDRHTRCGAFQWPVYSYHDLLKNCMIGPHPMWRKSVHESVGLFDESFVALGDQDFFIRVGARYNMLHIPEFTGLYWISDDGLSNRSELFMPEIQRIRQRYASNTASGGIDISQEPGDTHSGIAATRYEINRLKSLAAAKKEEKQYSESFELFLKVRSSGDLSVLVDLGDCLANQGRLDGAAGYYLEALRHESNNVQAHLGIGVLKLMEGKFSEAAISFIKALRCEPDSVKALCGLGMARSGQRRYSEAFDLYKRALSSDPENLTALNELLKTAYQLERLDEAEEYLTGYLAYHPTDSHIIFSLAGLRYRLGDYVNALDSLERVLVFAPDYEGGQELAELARTALGGGDQELRLAAGA